VWAAHVALCRLGRRALHTQWAAPGRGPLLPGLETREEEGEEEEEEEDSKGGYAEALVASQHPPLRLRDEAAHAAGAPRLRPWAPPQPGSRELLMEDTS